MSENNSDYDIGGSVGNIADGVSIEDGDLNQVSQNELKYEPREFPVSDPTGLNSRVGIVLALLGMVSIETLDRLAAALTVIGFVAFAGLMFALRQGMAFATEVVPRNTLIQVGLIVVFGSMIAALGYFATKTQSTCPECGSAFSYRHQKSVEVDRLPRPDKSDVRRVRRHMKCQECGHEGKNHWTNG